METPLNFKVGDRVVCVRTDDTRQQRFVGKAGVIIRVDDSHSPTAKIRWEDGEEFGLYQSKLEHEELYNSPLMKALR